tara:strand:+ start:583 stop:819 length:237 start_codon:yes stop_codon:yes gene_type:complete
VVYAIAQPSGLSESTSCDITDEASKERVKIFKNLIIELTIEFYLQTLRWKCMDVEIINKFTLLLKERDLIQEDKFIAA